MKVEQKRNLKKLRKYETIRIWNQEMNPENESFNGPWIRACPETGIDSMNDSCRSNPKNPEFVFIWSQKCMQEYYMNSQFLFHESLECQYFSCHLTSHTFGLTARYWIISHFIDFITFRITRNGSSIPNIQASIWSPESVWALIRNI